MSVDAIIVIVCSFAISVLGLLILARNHQQKTNRLFGILAFSIALWTIFNYLSVAYPTNLLITRLVFLGGIMTAWSLVSFIAHFPVVSRLNKSHLLKIFNLASIILVPVVFLPQFISSVTEDSIETSFLYPAFILYALYALFLLIVLIKKQLHNVKAVNQKQQLILVSWGVILYSVLALVSNVLLPLFLDNWSSSRFGPVFSLLLVGLVAYSIIKHKLFDIRLIVARSVGYILTLAVLGVFYGVVIIGIADYLLGGDSVDFVHQIVYTAAAIFLALTLKPIKKFFDKFSDKLFYRDNFDPQTFIDTFTDILVVNSDLNKLLGVSADLITRTLKPASIKYAVFTPGDIRFIGNSEIDFTKHDIESIQAQLDAHPGKVVLTEEIGESDRTLRRFLDNKKVAMTVKLNSRNDHIGFLFVGIKQSGNIYNRQDINTFEIIADELALAIQNSLRYEQIEGFNLTLQDKVSSATRELRRTNEKLKALDEAKDEFISMASHQLRTPLTSVKGYVSMVLEGDAGELNEQQRKLLDQAFVSSQRMVYLIADLLNVSRLRTGKFIIEAVKTNLAEIVEGEISQLYETAGARGLKLMYNKPEEFPELYLDETKIRQVVMNFVDNAIYYTPAGGEITVTLEATDKTIEFKVVDSGLGVPKKDQHHLFSKFYRADNARRARPDGTGLGLFMAKKVIIAQGGAIIFKSQEGKGSIFGFTFPRAKLEEEPVAPTEPEKAKTAA